MNQIPTKMRYKYKIPILIMIALTQSALCQQFSEKRIFSKTIPVNDEMTLEINNKYGSIHVSSIDSDTVTIRAEVEASANNRERTHKMLDGIIIEITETSHLVRAQTDFNKSIDMIFERFKGMTNKIIPYESKMQINYFIESPEYLNIRIINKYGDVYIENTSGSFSIDLSNGSFKANSINNTSSMKLSFCDASINKVKECRIDVSFSDIIIEESDNLEITSASTRFDMKNANVLNVQSRRDKFFIDNVRYVRGVTYFTEFRIRDLNDEINLETKYGSFEADHISGNCKMININSGYTDLYLTFDPLLSYQIDIRHSGSFLVLPEGKAEIDKEVLNEDRKEYLTSGIIGKNTGDLKVIIEANKGNIYLK